MSSVSIIDDLKESLYFAYRKAKADVYYRFRNPVALLKFETELEENIEALAEAIWEGGDSLFKEPGFTGTATFAPKGLKNTGEDHDSSTIFSSPSKSWNSLVEENSLRGEQKIKAEYRLVSDCGIGLHVLSALWVRYVGTDIEDQLFAGRPYANRIRRTRTSKEYNRFSIGTFDRYLDGYREWINDATDAMERLIGQKKDIVSFSTDASSYFHSIPVTILENPGFRAKYLTSTDTNSFKKRLTECLSLALKSWESNTIAALQSRESDGTGVSLGLPVGLSCSALIGNAVLDDFDKELLEQVKPEYYGRYVDDISIVMEGHEALDSPTSLWKWLDTRIENLEIDRDARDTDGTEKEYDDSECETLKVSYYPFGFQVLEDKEFGPQIESVKVDFKIEKTHLLLADSSSGKRAVEALRNALEEKSSEWRLLSHIPANSEDIGPTMIAAFDTSGSPAVRSSQLKKLSAQRGSVSLWLRDLEQLARLCEPKSWESHRAEFYKVIREQILTPLYLFDYYSVVSRVFDLALLCGDFGEFKNLIKSLGDSINSLETSTIEEWYNSTEFKPLSRPIAHWRESLSIEIQDLVHCTSPSSLTIGEKDELIQEIAKHISWNSLPMRNPQSEDIFYSLFKHDLAQLPFKELLSPEQLCTVDFTKWKLRDSEHPPTSERSFHENLGYWLHAYPKIASKIIPKQSEFLTGKFWTNVLSHSHFKKTANAELESYRLLDLNLPAVWFPTRPLSVTQAISWSTFLAYPPISHTPEERHNSITRQELSNWISILRGFNLESAISASSGESAGKLRASAVSKFGIDGDKVFIPPTEVDGFSNPRIAIASWRVNRERLNEALAGKPKLDFKTYRDFSLFLDRVVSPLPEQRRPDYLLLPELALPAAWFESFAGHLASKHSMGLISGIEYQLAPGDTVRNQVWASLPTKVVGYPIAAIYKQDKQHPAHHESRKLREYRGQTLQPENSWRLPPIIWHGNFAFALLICSELTNINYRAHLRGKIDALFVAELNRDLKTFEALVESAALDIHAFVAQSNTREFGDSRIRAPKKNDYERDLVRVRGGMNDHFAVGQLTVTQLRKFQSQNYSEQPFKPLPDGFREGFDPAREIIP